MPNNVFKLLILLPLISTNALGAETSQQVSIDPESGEVLSISGTSRSTSQRPTQPSTRLCLEGQSLIEIKTDGTVRCLYESSNTETSYLNVDVKSQHDTLPVLDTTPVTTSNRQSKMCQDGLTLAKKYANGNVECE